MKFSLRRYKGSKHVFQAYTDYREALFAIAFMWFYLFMFIVQFYVLKLKGKHKID